MKIQRTLTRRQVLAAGAGAVLASALACTGCAGKEEESEGPAQEAFDLESAYLPLGSVVTLDDGCDPAVERIVIARRPVCLASDEVYDYAAVVWPIGFISDVSGSPLENEVHLFNADAIKEIRHVGYSGSLEQEASRRLKESEGSDGSALEALLPMAMQMGVIEAKDGDDGR